MDQMIRELYAKMQWEGSSTDKIDGSIREEISNLLKDERSKMDQKDYERFQDKVSLIASAAEENGFVKGFRYAFYLFMECICED